MCCLVIHVYVGVQYVSYKVWSVGSLRSQGGLLQQRLFYYVSQHLSYAVIMIFDVYRTSAHPRFVKLSPPSRHWHACLSVHCLCQKRWSTNHLAGKKSHNYHMAEMLLDAAVLYYYQQGRALLVASWCIGWEEQKDFCLRYQFYNNSKQLLQILHSTIDFEGNGNQWGGPAQYVGKCKILSKKTPDSCCCFFRRPSSSLASRHIAEPAQHPWMHDVVDNDPSWRAEALFTASCLQQLHSLGICCYR